MDRGYGDGERMIATIADGEEVMTEAPRYFTGDNGVRIAADVQGSGPLVILVHGFPELRQSWHRLTPALNAAGYQTCAIDVRGYGDSDRPSEIADYRMEAIVGDLAAIAQTLSPQRPTTLIGHDWGASIVWNTAMVRPDLFGAVAALSIPWAGRGKMAFDAFFTKRFTEKNRFFYQAYFQAPGVAEAELEADPAEFLKAFYHTISGDAAEGDWPAEKPASATLMAGLRYPDALPDWLDKGYYDTAVATFTRTGFAGALNRYRNHARDYAWAEQFDHVIHQPALFIGGARDPALVLGASDPFPAMRENVPHLEAHMLDGCGHWIQAERAADIEKLVTDWLQRTVPAG